MNDPGRVLIVGAGPTGLGAAWRLAERGHHDFLLLEARAGPGGLAASVVDARGFTWDLGGHVGFSHYDLFDAVLDGALGDAWLTHRRRAEVVVGDSVVPYPLQLNLHRLPSPLAARAIAGLEAAARASAAPPSNFRDWILATAGEGLAEIFFFPYNEKVWGHPLDRLAWSWIGERVALPDLARVRRNFASGRDDTDWGPNRTFRFPARGGTGAIWRAVAAQLPEANQRYGEAVASLDLAARRLRLAGGETLAYDHLVSTMPLDRLAALATGLAPELADAAAALVSSAVHVVGVGLRGPQPPSLSGACWIYFPASEVPFYRATVFSNYSPANVPPEPGCWSLMTEVCESRHRPVEAAALGERVVAALVRLGLVPRETEVLSLWHRREAYGYPTPTLGRDAALAALLPALARGGVFSRGRFGAWKYEVSNQDHSFMQGVECVDRLFGEGEEPTLHRPHEVNAGRFRAAGARTG